jgi:hypothetical protein
MPHLDPPPGMPDDDDRSPDGGGPPSRTTALVNARIAAQNWADEKHKRIRVIQNGECFYLADMRDIVQWHMLDLYLGRACIVWRTDPALPAVAAPDVAFAATGWGD